MGFIIFLILFLIVAGAIAAVSLRYLPPPDANTILHIRHGSIIVSRGHVRAQACEDVTEVLRGGVTKGFIAITGEKRVVFSRQIPAELHQQLRNVLLNQ